MIDARPAAARLRRGRRVLIGEVAVLAAAAAAAAFVTIATPAATPAPPRFVPAALGDEPPHAVVLAREDGARAVALAIRDEHGHALLVATVLGPSGAGVDGLGSTFRVTSTGGASAVATGVTCGPGCYESTLAVPSGHPTAVTVALGRAGAMDRVTFALPAPWPPRPGLAIVRGAEAEYGRLRSLVTHERLASDPEHVVWTTYYAVAPDRLRYQVRGGMESIIIASTRWDREPPGSWQRSPQTPVQPITPYWAPRVEDAALLGTATQSGRTCQVVSFADPQIPAFFTICVEGASHRTLWLHMTAAGHFMTHRYGPFNAPIAIEPPARQRRRSAGLRGGGGRR